MKAFWMNPDCTVYAANGADEAKALYESVTGEQLDETYPIEVSEAELYVERIKHDDRNNPTKERISIFEYLNAADSPGFLCGIFL